MQLDYIEIHSISMYIYIPMFIRSYQSKMQKNSNLKSIPKQLIQNALTLKETKINTIDSPYYVTP